MNHPLKSLALVALAAVILASVAEARKAPTADRPVRSSVWSTDARLVDHDPDVAGPGLNASAVVTTLQLASYSFNSGAACTAQGWTVVDLVSQTGDYWHVDDFTTPPWGGTVSAHGIAFTPIQGTKSMWMAATPPPASPVNTVLCSYAVLPGYGNSWDQSICMKNCVSVAGGATTDLDLAFKMKFDTEPSYDYVALEYNTECPAIWHTGWTEIDGGLNDWDGAQTMTVAGSYAVGAGPVKVRIRFVSDNAWSGQDGLWPSFGVAVDSLSVENLPVEDFEGEAVGATDSDDWRKCNTPGFGNYLGLFKKANANYEDLCRDNLSCYWAALTGSTEYYTCGTPPQPAQKVVPHKNPRGEYIANEVWSPAIPITGSGSDFRLRYTVYRDLPLDNLVYHVWHVRTVSGSGCPGPWRDSGIYYYGDSKDWAIVEQRVGTTMNLTTAISMQVALGVVDMCKMWCGVYGTGVCHSPAPYFDAVKVLRVDTVGPQWDVHDVDTFQDTFATNGTLTGTARADAAIDIAPPTSSTITPGDSAVVFYVVDPAYAGTGTNASGLLNDPNISTYVGHHKTKKQAYIYVAVWPKNQIAKTGAPLSEGPGGQANRYPFISAPVIGGVTWTKIRMDYTYDMSELCAPPEYICFPVPGRFNVDLNDNLFTPGDTISYFFSATSAAGTNYFSTEFGTTTDITAAAANPMEFTILPAGGFQRGGDILYVDGADGLGMQSYFDGALMQIGMNDLVDRYDVRGPSSASGNRLGGRVANISAQLNAAYQFILWDTGSLPVTLGDGTGSPTKTDDYALLNGFLANLALPGGVYLCGDDVAENLNGSVSASAGTFRGTYMPFTLINSNHRLAPSLFQISPSIKFWPGRGYNDNFFVFGGCPELNDFDVIGADGGSLVQMSYNTASSANGAVVSRTNGFAHVVMSGFSLAYVRDDELNGLADRTVHLYRTLVLLGMDLSDTAAGELPSVSSLSQNYPNPFNPTTTIAYALKTRGHVQVNVYDVGGRLVRTIANEVRPAGPHQITWDGRDGNGTPVSSGVYFYRLVAGDFSQTKKMVLLK